MYKTQHIGPIGRKVPVSVPIWSELRARSEPVTVAELHTATRARPGSIQQRLQSWTRAGLVEVAPGKPFGGASTFVMTQPARTLNAPPSLRIDGTATKPLNGRKRMWTAIRVLRRFDLPTLLMTAEVTRRSAEDYINCLLRAGILTRATRGNSTTRTWSVYVVAAASGPKPPRVRHRATPQGRIREVIDPNTGAIIDISPKINGRKGTVIVDEYAALFFDGRN